MSSRKLSISMSRELFDAIESLRAHREEDRSPLLEMLLREHPMVRRAIRRRRESRRPGPKKGRDPEELQALARSARRQWEKREEAGEVAFVDR